MENLAVCFIRPVLKQDLSALTLRQPAISPPNGVGKLRRNVRPRTIAAAYRFDPGVCRVNRPFTDRPRFDQINENLGGLREGRRRRNRKVWYG